MADLLQQIQAAPDAPVPGRKRGTAPAIRRLKLKHPELSHAQIAERVGCHPSNVTVVLKTFLGKHSETQLREYQESQADAFDAIAMRSLVSITPKKLAKANAVQLMTVAGIATDKARLVRGQATAINVNVLIDIAEALRSKPQLDAQTIGTPSASE